jgi:hypothetical protein
MPAPGNELVYQTQLEKPYLILLPTEPLNIENDDCTWRVYQLGKLCNGDLNMFFFTHQVIENYLTKHKIN